MLDKTRRNLIKGIGAVIMVGSVPTFLPRLINGNEFTSTSDQRIMTDWRQIIITTRNGILPLPTGPILFLED